MKHLMFVCFTLLLVSLVLIHTGTTVSTRQLIFGLSAAPRTNAQRLSWRSFSTSDSKPRILVTGGCGFVGGHLIPKLQTRFPGATLKVVDNLWRGSIGNLRGDDGTAAIDLTDDLLVADLTDPIVAEEATRNVDIVIHLANIVAGIDDMFDHQHSLFQQNMRINLNVIRFAKQNGVRDFVYTGTAYSFPKHLQQSNQKAAIPENKTYPANPESAYGWSKLVGEYELKLAQQAGIFNVGIVRFHDLYGDRISYGPNCSQALPKLMRKAIRSPLESLILWGGGKQYSDFLHVDDAIEGIFATLDRGMNMGAIQIGSGVRTTLLEASEEVSRLARSLLRKDLHFSVDSTKPEGSMGTVAELTRAKVILRWEAKVSFRAGMERMFRWIQNDIELKASQDKAARPKVSQDGAQSGAALLPISPPARETSHAPNAMVNSTPNATVNATRKMAKKFKVTAQLSLWGAASNTGYLGNQMFLFQSTVAIALHNNMQAVFSRPQLRMLNDTFDLDDVVAKYQIGVIEDEEVPLWEGVGGHVIDPKRNVRMIGFLQDVGLLSLTSAHIEPKGFYSIRSSHLEHAKAILPGVPNCVAVHLRFFPTGHLAAGNNRCPSSTQLRNLVHKLATQQKCVFVFSNDVARAKEFITAPCIHFISPGETTRTKGSFEVHPTGQRHEVARDFAALTLCDDLVLTCGTFGALAALLHIGQGSVYWYPDDSGTVNAFKERTRDWIAY